ncbi:Cna B-type domain-containing protein, partial [Oscillospiraceae bacterium 50-16]
ELPEEEELPEENPVVPEIPVETVPGGDTEDNTNTDVDVEDNTDVDTDTDVEDNTDADTNTDTDVEGDTDADTDTDTDVEDNTDADTDTDTDVEDGSDADTDTDTDVEDGSDADTDTDTDVEDGSDADTDTDTDVEGDTDADTDTDTDVEDGSDTDTDVEDGSDNESSDSSDSSSDSESSDSSDSSSDNESSDSSDSSSDSDSSDSSDSSSDSESSDSSDSSSDSDSSDSGADPIAFLGDVDTITWIVEVKEAETVSSLLDEFLAKAALLPNEVNEENYEEVGALLEEILAVFAGMSEEEQADASIADAYAKVLSLWEEYEGVKAEILAQTNAAMIGETGYDTLQNAIKEAQEGDTIVMLRDVNESVLLPAMNVTLDLNGYTLTGSGKSTMNLFALRGEPEVTLKNGTIVGAEGYRTVVVNSGNLKAENVTFKPSGSLLNEGMQSSGFGGGCIYIDKGNLTVDNCTFSGDAGTYKESASYMGAGKFVKKAANGSHINAGSGVGVLTITNSTFENSKSTFGAVYAANTSLTVKNSTFTNNGNGLQLDNKEGIFDISDCIFSGGTKAINASGGSKMTLNVKDSSFSDFKGGSVINANGNTNIAGGSFNENNADSNGIVQLGGGSLVMDGTELKDNTSGGVVKTSSASNVTMRNVTATGNIGTTSMSSGGTVLNANSIKGKTVILENVTATGNEQTKEHGGAFYLGGSSNDTSTVIEITGCTLTGNTAKNGGGAIYLNNKGTTTITDTVISGNTANGSGKYAGGGIQVASTSGTVTLEGSTRIYNNETPKATVKHLTVGATADIALVSNNVKTDFASEDAVQRATLVLNNKTTFTDDDGITYTLTKSDAKGLHYSSVSSSSKKFYWPAGYYTVKVEPAVVYLNAPENGTHQDSDKVTLAGNLEGAVKAAQKNGAKTIYVCGNVDVLSEADVEALNSGLAFTRCKDHPNGHMFTIKDDVTLDGAHIDGNRVDGNASLIYVPASGHLTITGDTVIENGKNAAPKGTGGAIQLQQGGLTMTGGTITGNSAREGGGIYAYSSHNGNKIVFEGGKVSNNTATGGNGGGGAYIGATSSEFGVDGGRTYFENNVANELGGGVFLVNGINANTHHYIYKATFTGNKSYRTGYYYDGGAIYIQSGTTAHMKNVYVSGNTDSDKAGNNYTAVAVCPSGELAVYELEGLLSVNNNGKVDIGVIAGGSTSSVGPMVYLPSYAPGGGSVSYVYSNGKEVNLSDHQFMKGYFRVKTVASDSAISNAKATAEEDGVVITGNYATQFGAGIMTNGILKIGTETTTLRVNKVWSDGAENHANDQILVYLTQDGKIVDQDFRNDSFVVLNKDNNWSYTWTNLGDQFTWGVKEASVDGYLSEVKVEKDAEFNVIADKYYIATITNTPGGEKTGSLVITKTALGLDPDASYKFTLKLDNVGDKVFAIQLPDGSLAPIYNNEVTFYLKDGQSAVVDGLPEGFTYEVTEASSNDYLTTKLESNTLDGDTSITTVDFVNVAKTQVSVKKMWMDDEGLIRPKSITLKLMRNGEEIDTQTLTPQFMDENGVWNYTWKDLPKFDAAGKEYKYTVEEVDVPDYNVSYSEEDGVLTITNTRVLSVSVEKVWQDHTGSTMTAGHPDSVTVKLYKVNGENRELKDTVILNAENNWKHTFEKLDVGVYEVEEDSVDGYTTTLTPSIDNGNSSIVITNKENPTSLTVNKKWENDTETNRPVSIQVQLLKNGIASGEAVTLSAATGWSYTWEGLDPKAVWTVDEVVVPEHYTSTQKTENGVVTITNKYEEPEKPAPTTTQLTVVKEWKDEDNAQNTRPVSIQVQLFRNDEAYGAPVSLSESNNWTHTWENLPIEEDVVYSVEEISVPD